MKVIIHYNGEYEDSLGFECESIEEARETARRECAARGWDENCCWSEMEDEV